MARPAVFLGIALILASAASLARGQPSCGGIINGQSIIYTPNFPRPPPSGQICRWTLLPATGQIVSLYFFDFDVGPNSYLDIYRGTTAGTAADLLTTYTNRGPGAATITVDGPVTLQFRGAALQLSRGFTIAFSSVIRPQRSATEDAFTGCGGVVNGAGTVASPGHSGWYPINSRCIWKLTPCEIGAQIQIEFSAFDVENDFDRVDVYTGQGANTVLFSTYTGNTVPQIVSIDSPVTVMFTSDNINAGNTGFSLRFSTVSTTIVEADPLASPEACPALCPATVQPDPTSYCYAHDDPHIKTFCGPSSTYEFQYEGVYYLYKHKTAPISVQAAFQTCEPPFRTDVTCVCAVAVRYCDEVFVVDRCLHVGIDIRYRKFYKAGTGAQMSITTVGAGFKVRLPTGLTVDIGSSPWIGYVDIRDSLANRNMAGGLCDCQQGYRCGTSASDYATAGKSWRVLDEESLFVEWKHKNPCNIASCSACKLPTYTLPKGVDDATLLTPYEYSNGRPFRFKRAIGKRAVSDEGSAPLAFAAPWTQTLAEQHCRSRIAEHPAISLCQQMLNGNLELTGSINDCMLDILLTGETAFTSTALEGSKLNCLHTLNNTGLSETGVLPLMCPNECSSRGRCSNGVCTCNDGWFGPDCTIDPSEPPNLTPGNLSEATNCTQNATLFESYLLQNVYGQIFYDVIAGYPKCRIQSQAQSFNDVSAVVTTIVSPEYVSPSVVKCRLPAGKPGETVRYVISVSNNGVAYSNNVTTTRYFCSGCGQSFSDSGTLNSPNYPFPYPNNASCTWTLTAAAGKVVQLLFNSFNVENGFDILRVYDSGRLVDEFTGNLGAQPARPYGQSVKVVFNSDASVRASGFSIAFTSVVPNVSCGGAVEGSAIINSPLYPDLYPNNAYCVWTLTPKAGLSARLHFTAFSLEAGRDYLRVYATGTKVVMYTGAAVPADYSPGASPYLVFRSDAIIQQSGFSLNFTSV